MVRFLCQTVILQMMLSTHAYGQQRAVFTQFMFNPISFNPAFAGHDEALSVTFHNRFQWLGVDGAPVTQALSGHSLFRNEQVGVGFSVISDRIGVHRSSEIMGMAAYHLRVSSTASVSAGIQAGLNHNRSDYSAIGQNDPRVGGQDIPQTSPELGVGLGFRSRRFESGISVPHLIRKKIAVNDSVQFGLGDVHYFLFSKYSIVMNNAVKLEPGLLLKRVNHIPLSFDLNVNAIFHDVLTVGISYRRNESIDFLWRARVTPQLQLGYSYDHVTGNASSVARNSHEFMINYLFSFAEDDLSSPR